MVKIINGISGSPGRIGGRLFIVENDDDFSKIKDKNIDNLIFGFTEMKHEYILSLRKAGGFIFKYGGCTSHVITITRELGIPSICGIGEEFDSLTSGMRIIINGTIGAIEIDE